MYWLAVILGFVFMGLRERKGSASHNGEMESDTSSEQRETAQASKIADEGMGVNTAVREVK